MFNILQSRWFTFLAVVVIGLFSLMIIKLQPSLKEVNQEVNNLDQKITEAQKSVSDLQKLQDYIKSPAYLEQQARIKLNYKKPDENVVFVYKNQYNQNPASASQGANNPAPQNLANWQKWLKYLLSK